MSGENILEKAARSLELPPEVALGAVKLIISGREAVRAINHHGILVYEPQRVVFRTDKGAVEILGDQLSLAELNVEYLRIVGRIDSVRLDGDGHEA